MRQAWIQSSEALRQRMIQPQQVAAGQPEAEMPPYMESFLAHVRLLVGVPFEYLVPDPNLLPDESIRFFFLDRSWSDRVVDGAIAVGKIGTREQAHHQAHEPAIRQQLDITERIVRSLQLQEGSFPTLKTTNDGNPATNGTGQVITGFLLRSAAVSGWPQMDVRAYGVDLQEPLDPSSADAQNAQLKTLRLERLSPSVMIALFQGIPTLVTLEEPHHAVQFGVFPVPGGFQVGLHQANGTEISRTLPVPVRQANARVVSIAALRRALFAAQQSDSSMPAQTGGASLAIELLNLPWRQRFEGTKDQRGGVGQQSAGFQASLFVGARVLDSATKQAVQIAFTQSTGAKLAPEVKK